MEEKYKIHCFYIFSILVLIIIGLCAINWSKIPQLVILFSFAATLTSMILALLAIIYAYYSNSAFATNISTFNQASNKTSENARELSEISKRILQELGASTGLWKEIDEHVRKLPETLKEVGGGETEKKIHEKAEDKYINEKVDAFFKKSSLSGLEILYAAHLSIDKKIAFNLRDLTGKNLSIGYDYSYGFLIASYAMGLLSYTIANDIWNISEINEALNRDIEKKVYERAKQFDDQNKGMNTINDLKVIEKYFNAK